MVDHEVNPEFIALKYHVDSIEAIYIKCKEQPG
jgi:hypothetical protein